MNIKSFLFKSAIIAALFGQHVAPKRNPKDSYAVKAYRHTGNPGGTDSRLLPTVPGCRGANLRLADER